ncbi:MAG: hypothetical protein K2N80_17200 [Lachnospiraceae bacterium]|nr:hypothetical protein [Lachnospiraceae bacterium]
MKRTQETLKVMSKILTENDKVQEIMGMLAEKAEENNLTAEGWESVKTSILSDCFFMIAQKDEKIRNDLAMDLYEAFNA